MSGPVEEFVCKKKLNLCKVLRKYCRGWSDSLRLSMLESMDAATFAYHWQQLRQQHPLPLAELGPVLATAFGISDVFEALPARVRTLLQRYAEMFDEAFECRVG